MSKTTNRIRESGLLRQATFSGIDTRWRGAADLAKQKNLNVMETLSEAGLQGSEALAKASTHTYAQSFQQALRNGSTFDQALKQATADTAMETITWRVPLKDLLDDIKGDPKKARTEIDKALKRDGIYMTPLELQWLGAVAAEASFLQYDSNFYKKIALEMMTGMDYETAHAVASRKAWQEAAREMSVIEMPDRVSNAGETFGETQVHSQELQQEYMEFKKVLGENAPETLEDFENIKYNNPKQWESLKTMKEQTIFVENAPCVTTPKKFYGYFLRPGAKHANQFFDIGYTQGDVLQLRYDIAQQFDMDKAVGMKTDEEGVTTFNMYMMLGVDKKEKFRTGWQIDAGDKTPRIITAFRNDREQKEK